MNVLFWNPNFPSPPPKGITPSGWGRVKFCAWKHTHTHIPLLWMSEVIIGMFFFFILNVIIANIFEVGRYDSTKGIICRRTVLVSPSVTVTVWYQSFSTWFVSLYRKIDRDFVELLYSKMYMHTLSGRK